MKTTTEIITKQRRDSAHPCDDDGECMVSTVSRWCDDVWLFDTPSRNLTRTAITIDWASVPTRLVPVFKDLFWSLLISRPDGQPYALSQAGTIFSRLRYLAKWMEQRKRHSLASISPAFVTAFVSDLKAHLKNESKKREAEYTTGSVVGYLKTLDFAFEQRSALAARGHEGLGIQPFGEASAWGLADEIAPYVESFTPPIPDELVIPIVSAAYRFIRDVADDVIELQSRILASESIRIGKKNPRKISNRQFRKRRTVIIQEFARKRFQDRPWLAELLAVPQEDQDTDGSSTVAFRRLMADVIAAAVIVVRFSTGIRHGEILTFAPGLNDDGLPICVDTEPSIGGAYDLFFVKGVVSKGWDHPEDARWLLAGRVNGGDNIPDAVRALKVIEQVLAPWRERSSDPDVRNQLLLQFGIHGFPRNPAHILPMLSEHLANVMKDFYERRVDRSGIDFTDPKLSKYAGTNIRRIQSKQWRKTWANFVIRTNRKLLPAISQQFQHFSTVLTQVAYIGKDAEQLGLVEDAATERAIEFVHNALEGNPGIGGMARKAVDKLDDLKAKVRGIGEEQQCGEIRDWLAERDIKIWPAQHGKCFIGMLPAGSRCHAAGETLDWSNQTPNFLTRSARLCSGCACFGVDGEDIPFWADRYIRNKRIWDQAVGQQLELHYTVARDHFRAAERILRSLDVDIDQLHEDYPDAD